VYPIAVVALIFIPLFSFGEPSRVSIYNNADKEQFGQTYNRNSLLSIDLTEFIHSPSVDTGAEGIQTAVFVDARVKNALDNILENRDFIFIDDSVLSAVDSAGVPAYRFRWNEYGFEIVFSLEKAGAGILKVIERTYSRNAYLLGELRRSYSDNYAVRVYRAEDLIEGADGIIDFREAMLAATVIGDTFQPLLGIHDGLGVLDEIGLITARIDVITEGSLVEYRPYEKAGPQLRSFIHSIAGMQGDFVDNLFSTVSDIFKKKSNDDHHIVLPEDFFLLKDGDNTDYSLFYYDILKRAGYQVRFVVIDSAGADGSLFSTVLFQERGTELWGRIDGQVLEREKSDRLSRMPALVFSGSVKYFEPDIEELFKSSVIELPPPSKWRTSLY